MGIKAIKKSLKSILVSPGSRIIPENNGEKSVKSVKSLFSFNNGRIRVDGLARVGFSDYAAIHIFTSILQAVYMHINGLLYRSKDVIFIVQKMDKIECCSNYPRLRSKDNWRPIGCRKIFQKIWGTIVCFFGRLC